MTDSNSLDLNAVLSPLTEHFSGRVSIALQCVSDGFSYTYNATETMSAASLIKLPLLIKALEQVAQGRLSLTSRHTLKNTDQVSGSGVLHTLGSGLNLTLRDLLTLMIIVSDNTATNMLIDLVGREEVNDFCQRAGLTQTNLAGKLQLPKEQQNDAQRRGERNTTCAADMLGLLTSLQRGDLLPPELTEIALEILKKQQFTEALARYLPTDAELHQNAVTVASKSGCLRGVWHDAGLVYDASGRPLYALIVMTTDSKDRSFSFEQEGMMLIAEVSRRIFHTLQENPL